MDNTIIIAGDLCPKDRIAQLFEEKQYSEVFHNIKPVIEQAGYAIVNLEAPIVEGKVTPIVKSGPNLKCSDNVIGAIHYAGFKGVTLANNHFFDYGEEGALTTMQKLSDNKIDYVGAGKDIEDAAKILYVAVGAKKVAIINCCEHEFSIATEKAAGSNPLNLIKQHYAIKEARKKSDHVLVIVHGGHEMCQIPSPRMKETYRFFIDSGADAVINHHQHCYSGYEIYEGKPIFYGLGNFLFDWEGKRNSIWNEGYFVRLHLEKSKNVEFELTPYSQCDNKPVIKPITENDLSCFWEHMNELNDIISNDVKLRTEWESWINSNSNYFLLDYQPYSSRLSKALFVRGVLPSFITRKKKYRIINHIECESHLDRLRFVIRNIKE